MAAPSNITMFIFIGRNLSLNVENLEVCVQERVNIRFVSWFDFVQRCHMDPKGQSRVRGSTILSESHLRFAKEVNA